MTTGMTQKKQKALFSLWSLNKRHKNKENQSSCGVQIEKI